MVPRFLWLNDNIPSLNCAFFNPQFKKSCTLTQVSQVTFSILKKLYINPCKSSDFFNFEKVVH